MLKCTGFLLLVLAAFSGFVLGSSDNGPVVETKYGKVRGVEATNSDGKVYYSFKGLPYAKPPVGKLRWQRPHPVSAWQDVRDASDEGEECKQFDLFYSQTIRGAEDCLYLNVYVPEKPEAVTEKKAVMVFIHGGGYNSGTGAEYLYGPGKLMNHDVILVTFNYRLGAFGFLSTGDDMIPGNFGLWDQVEALKFVKETIEAFGGDPNKVTIFGESAGSGSVSLHLLSKRSKGYFRNAIMQSGTEQCSWSVQTSPLTNAKGIAEKLNCPTHSTLEIRKCLQSKTEDEILKAYMDYTGLPEMGPISFAPVTETIDDWSFIHEKSDAILKGKRYNKVPTIVGLNKNEGVMFSIMLSEAYKGFGKSFFETQLEDFQGRFVLSVENRKQLAEMVKKQYFSHVTDFDDKKQTWEPLNQMVSDSVFNYPIFNFTNNLVSNGNPDVYFYHLTYRGKMSISDRMSQEKHETTHADDLQYIFDCGFFASSNLEGKDLEVSKEILTMWTNFAKTGEPVPKNSKVVSVDWKKVTKEKFNYLEIGSELLMKTDYEPERMAFWRAIEQNAANQKKEQKQEL